MPNFTPQQSAAIYARDVSVALAAGAGCGKTFVLTERFLECLEPGRAGGPLRLDQLTAITFTERAAREMRQRIRSACLDRLTSAAEEHVSHWLRTLRDLDSARISTIHSFCGALLRAHAVEARLDPHFQVLDATAAQTLLFELIDQQLRDRLARHDDEVIGLVVTFGLDRLREMAARLLAERQQIDWEYWRGETPGQLLARWQNFWQSVILPRMLGKIGGSPEATAILQILAAETPGHALMAERCAALRERLPCLHASKNPAADLEQIRAAAIVQGGGGKKAWSSEDVYESFRDSAKALRDLIDKAAETATFDLDKALPAAEASLALLKVAHGLAAAYEERKKALAALDFDDLLIRSRDLLSGPFSSELRQRLAAQTRLLLVDEFQDTDPLQVELVTALCDGRVAEGKLFVVGDRKQSIYRFRGADPHVFSRLRDAIPAAGRLPLTRNFRSQPAILEFVNRLFSAEMGSDYEALQAHRPQVGPRPAVEFLWATEPQEESNEGDAPAEASSSSSSEDAGNPDALGSPTERIRRREARWIARRIRGMVDGGEKLVVDEDDAGRPALRAVALGDITLLFRALTNVEYYEDALREHGIPYYLVGGHAFYAQQEIFDIVNLLRAVASPCDEVSLAGILRSPMFGLLDETLYRLSRHPGGLSAGFSSAMEPGNVAVAGMPADERSKVLFAAETLVELRAQKDRLPVAQLLHRALERTGYDAMLLADFLGERKLANLHKLIEQARQFDAAGIFTLADFIVQLSQFVARQPDEPLAATQPESINAVRLMSIHQSKGLEFPVVVVVDVDRRRQPSGNAVAFTPELGPMVRMADCPSGYELFAEAETDEDLAEMTRLFYVAATRAADYLILSSGVDDLDKPRGPWLDLLARRFDLRTGLALDGETANRLVSVIGEEPRPPKQAAAPQRHDLQQTTIDEARKLAAAGGGDIPRHLAPIAVDRTARKQYSVSRLHGTLHPLAFAPAGEEDDAYVPRRAIDALELGTLVHAVLADLARGGDDAHAAVERLLQKHAPVRLNDANANLAEARQLIAGLTATPRWRDVRDAQRRHVELEFLLAWPLGDGGSPGTYIQGFIDCLYFDRSGRWRLLDYKTNRVTAESLPGLVKTYEMQMLVYALAAERILKTPPADVALHFLRGNVEHTFAWDDAARQRAVELVEGAIDATRL